MALSGDALASLEQVKAYLDKTSTDDDALLEGLIEAVSAQFNTFTGRKLRARAYGHDPAGDDYSPDNTILDGSGHAELLLPQYPIVSLSGLEIGGAAHPTETVHIDRQAGVIRLASGVFSRGLANVKLAYTAGFEVIPADLAQAAVEQSVVRFQQSFAGQGRLGLAARTVADGTVSFRDGELLPQVRAVLERYVNRSLL